VTRPGSLLVLFSDFRFLNNDCRGQLVELARHNDIVMIHTYDPLEQVLPAPGYYRITDGVSSVAVDTANPEVRAKYQQRYAEQQQKFQQLCIELGLFRLDIATDDDMIAELISGLGLRKR